MKKLYLLLFVMISLLNISHVKADTYSASNYSSYYDQYITAYLTYQEKVEQMINIWEQNFSPQYPYYYITYTPFVNNSSMGSYVLMFSDSPYLVEDTLRVPTLLGSSNQVNNSYTNYIKYDSYYDTMEIFTSPNPSGFGGSWYYFTINNNYTNSIALINHGMIFNGLQDYNTIIFNGFTSSTYNQTFNTFNVNEGDIMPDYVSLYNGTYSPVVPDNYTEINLNDYSYVILTLNSYTPIDTQYSTTIYTQGSLCATPVYNYGMREKKDYYSGYQVQGCTEYYTDFTPVNFYILPSDVENHAVYYIKSDNSYVNNKIKVDNRIFTINYFTSQNEDNPSVIINGRSYPTIPYDSLTDTAIISSDEGYISGVSCALGDVNCYYENTGISIDDLFLHPLDLLKSVWGAITNVFVIISAFISLLPPTLQGFMFTAFMLAVVLGIIKIIIG